MIKAEFNSQCRVSDVPFTSFRWQGAMRRWRETIVCATVAREKNCCQSCLADLEYGVPYHVRDHVMAAIGEDTAPRSDVNSQYHWANKKQKMLDEQINAGGHDTYEKLVDNADKLRNLAALDTGPVEWTQLRNGPLSAEEQERLRLRKAAEKRPPSDPSIKTLFVAGVPPSLGRKELMPYFLAYGPVHELSVNPQKLSAVVTFHDRAAAEKAVAAMHNNLTIGKTRLRVQWARRKASSSGLGAAEERDNAVARAGHSHYGGSSSSSGSTVAPPPRVRLPPGVSTSGSKRPAPYASMDPDAHGARPDRE